jgi:cell division protein FtsQ
MFIVVGLAIHQRQPMARNDSAVLPHEEAALAQEELLHPEMDARFTDLDEEDGTPFLRKQKRVPVRRGPLPKKTTNQLKWVGLALVALVMFGVAYALVYRYGERSWRFRVESSDQIEVDGTQNVTHAQVMEVMGSDIGRNIFFVPLDERRAQLEQIPWVESAAVMRFVPNRLKVDVRERTPVAFVRVGSHIGLIDLTGHIMEMPAHNKTKYSFPVIAGTRDSEPLSTRAARMKVYNELQRELDSDGGHYSSELSEVDLTDPEDARVLVDDPSGDVLLHLGSVNSGSGNFLDRFKLYKTHVSEWRQQFEKLDSVDLRYERQIVVNPDLRSTAQPAALSPAAAKAAVTAGVPAVAITAAALVKRQQVSASVAKSGKPAVVPAKATAKLPPKATVHTVKPGTKTHKQAGKRAAKKTAKKLVTKAAAKTAKKPAVAKKSQTTASAAKSVKPAGLKSANAQPANVKPSNAKTASAKTATLGTLAPAPPHQASGNSTNTSASGKPHAAIVN